MSTSKSGIENVAPQSIAQLERALTQLLQAFGHNTKTVQESMIANEEDGYINQAIIIPGLSIFGLPLRIDQERSMLAGLAVECKPGPSLKPAGVPGAIGIGPEL